MFTHTIALLALMATTSPVEAKVYQKADILSKIELSALANGIDPEKMLALGICESGLQKFAWNSGDPQGGAHGIFQYLRPTFYAAAKQYGLLNPSIYNSDHQIKITAYLLAQNKWRLWYNCSKKIGMVQ